LVLQYISIDEQIGDILVNHLSKMKNVAYSRNKLELVEKNSLLKRKRLLLGWEGSLMCYLFMENHFFSSKNDPG
jgi:hypothetical protein